MTLLRNRYEAFLSYGRAYTAKHGEITAEQLSVTLAVIFMCSVRFLFSK